MKVILTRVSKGHDGENLPATSLSYESGAVTLEVVETAKRPTVLALLATGRMAPDEGTVILDAGGLEAADARADAGTTTQTAPDAAALRAIIAIVDAPDVSEPVSDLRLTTVVREELMFAERPNSRRAVLDALDDLDAGRYADYEMQNVPPMVRLRILAELAVSRPGIEGIVLTSPDRHGGEPFDWWAVASDLALRGLAVLVLASEASVAVVREVSTRFEADRLAELERQAEAARRAEAEAEAEADAQQRLAASPPNAPATDPSTPLITTTTTTTDAASDARVPSAQTTTAHTKDLA